MANTVNSGQFVVHSSQRGGRASRRKWAKGLIAYKKARFAGTWRRLATKIAAVLGIFWNALADSERLRQGNQPFLYPEGV
jgi:hypothetical protein